MKKCARLSDELDSALHQNHKINTEMVRLRSDFDKARNNAHIDAEIDALKSTCFGLETQLREIRSSFERERELKEVCLSINMQYITRLTSKMWKVYKEI